MTTASEDRHRLSFLLGEIEDELEKHLDYLEGTDALMVLATDMHRRFWSLRKTVGEAQDALAKIPDPAFAEAALARIRSMTLVSDVSDDIPL